MTAIRRLAAILAADVAGYSRLMGADEDSVIVDQDFPDQEADDFLPFSDFQHFRRLA